MNNSDRNTLLLGSAVGLGIFAALFYFAKKAQTIPVVSPSLIKWDVQ